MSEAEAIQRTKRLNTIESLQSDFEALGVQKGMVLIVHASLSAMGWVCGGPVAVIQALMATLTGTGTLVMPAHSGDYSDPRDWENPPVPPDWFEPIRNTMPAYQPEITPTRGMGAIAETFRKFPNVVRSFHPAVSFTAWGKDAEAITENHSIDYSLGEDSPLARIYDLDGWVLLLGVAYHSNTSFHLAEYRTARRKYIKAGAPIIEAGRRVWREYEDIELNTDRFDELGADFELQHPVGIGSIGLAESKLFRQRAAVDFGQKWLENRRK
jgi:aminoglycoside 3-N-acetyltransferase